MKLTAKDLYELGVIDEVIKEPKGGAQTAIDKIAKEMKKEIITKMESYQTMKVEDLVETRYQKFRNMGEYIAM